MQKTPYVFPIVGGRKVSHLIANIEVSCEVLVPCSMARTDFFPGAQGSQTQSLSRAHELPRIGS
jgi:hypothetical protein